ncbi:exodeoxyribonuclease V subunit beta [Luteimonas pelagia]
MSGAGHRDDPYLTLPLTGIHAIEASAGTGKTFTLATLVLRLLVERRLGIGDVLAVTFTEAATQELRARTRARLLLAVSLAGTDPVDGEAPEAAITRAVLDAHLAGSGEAPDALRRRLRQAADGIDLAAIFTIHGFCARVLREHAFASGQGFDALEVLADDGELRERLAEDLWRSHGDTPEGADDLLALWRGGPEALAGDLRALLGREPLRPAPAALAGDPAPALRAAGAALADAFRAHGDDFRAALARAVDGKVLHGGSYKVDWIDELFDTARAWCESGEHDRPLAHGKLHYLRRETLRDKTSVKAAGRTPDSPVCDALQAYLDALAAVDGHREARRVVRLHRVRDDARARLARLKQQRRVQTYDDMIDGVADALAGPHGDDLADALRRQYAVALVDEFQDTDPRQWRIFDRVFGSASADPALFVIGDPKQAIYGFRGGDVETYLRAKHAADEAPPLAHNFRSRPSVLRAIQALYDSAQAAFEDAARTSVAEPPFVDPRIGFHGIAPGGVRQDGHYLRDGQPAPALTLWRAPEPVEFDRKGDPKPWSAPRSREMATQACVAAIHRVLADAHQGKAALQHKDGRVEPVQPGDIAVLVRSHHQATLVRDGLARAGIPSVAAGRQSLFATGEARELHVLLLALLHGADDARLRTALSTVLLGQDAGAIAALAEDGEALRGWQRRALAWRERLRHGGPLALVGDLCADNATRLVGLLDGERRLTNYLQLGERLQEASTRTLGLHGLVDWLARAIGDASADDETQLLRLESDARCVQIVTLHKSKGLEYPLVFLPFAGIGGKPPSPGRHLTASGDDGRILHWKLQAGASGWDDAEASWKTAQRAEDARLLYVGLTRAQHALWLATGDFYNGSGSPLAAMVGDIPALSAALGDALRIDDAPPPDVLPWLQAGPDPAVPPARTARRRLDADWWVYSFSQLARADAAHDDGRAHETDASATEAMGSASDEPAQPLDDAIEGAATFDGRFSGSRFGNVLHAALENARFERWAGWRDGDAAPAGEDRVLRDALGAEGYGAADLEDGLALLTSLVGRTLNVPLPEGGPLHALPQAERRAEIEFHFAMRPTRVPALLDLLHAHGIVATRRGFGVRRRLEGLMTGKIDLTYRRDGRWYVLDYKSNRLPGYDAAHLSAAMAHGEYDLQALIYTLALHRWLRFRLGDAYDYGRDFGGIRYLFCRGLDPADAAGAGVHARTHAPELVHALDALFCGTMEAAA